MPLNQLGHAIGIVAIIPEDAHVLRGPALRLAETLTRLWRGAIGEDPRRCRNQRKPPRLITWRRR